MISRKQNLVAFYKLNNTTKDFNNNNPDAVVTGNVINEKWQNGKSATKLDGVNSTDLAQVLDRPDEDSGDYLSTLGSNAKMVGSSCGTFDGVGDYVEIPIKPNRDCKWTGRFYHGGTDGFNGSRTANLSAMYYWGVSSGMWAIRFGDKVIQSTNTAAVGWHDFEFYQGILKINGDTVVDGSAGYAAFTSASTRNLFIGAANLELGISVFYASRFAESEIVCGGVTNVYTFSSGWGTQIHDVSGNGNHGTLTTGAGGLATFWGGSQTNVHWNLTRGASKVIDFNGSTSYATITGVASTTNNWSMSLSFTPSAAQNDLSKIIDFQTGRALFEWSSSVAGWVFYDTSPSFSTVDTNKYINTPVFFTVTQAGTSALLYRNGVQIGSGETSGRALGGTARLGSRFSADTGFFNGRINRVCIHDRAITSNEVAQVHAGLCVTSGLIAEYNPSRAFGTTLPDSAGTNNATLVNTQFVYIPALADGSNDALGLGLTNPAGPWHNNCEVKIKQNDSAFETNPFWHNGSSFLEKSYADLIANPQGQNAIYIDKDSRNFITGISTYLTEQDNLSLSYLTISSNFDPNNCSITSKFRVDYTTTEADVLPIFQKSSSIVDEPLLLLKVVQGTGINKVLQFSGFNNGVEYGIKSIIGLTNVNDGMEHFVTATYNGITWKIYLDGVLYAEKSDTIVLANENLGCMIGHSHEANFTGLLGDIILHEEVLSLTEIKGLIGRLSNPPMESPEIKDYIYLDGTRFFQGSASSSLLNGQVNSLKFTTRILSMPGGITGYIRPIFAITNSGSSAWRMRVGVNTTGTVRITGWNGSAFPGTTSTLTVSVGDELTVELNNSLDVTFSVKGKWTESFQLTQAFNLNTGSKAFYIGTIAHDPGFLAESWIGNLGNISVNINGYNVCNYTMTEKYGTRIVDYGINSNAAIINTGNITQITRTTPLQHEDNLVFYTRDGIRDLTGRNVLTNNGITTGKEMCFGANNKYLDVVNSSNLRIVGDKSISFTFETYKDASIDGTTALLVKRPTSAGGMMIYLSSTGNTLRIQTSSPSEIFASTFVPAIGVKYKIDYVFTSTNTKLYVNGVLNGTGMAMNVNLLDNTSNLRFGLDTTSVQYSFNGKIYETKIYNKALSAEQIKQDYNKSLKYW